MILKERDLKKLFAPPPKHKRSSWLHTDHRSWWQERTKEDTNEAPSPEVAQGQSTPQHTSENDHGITFYLPARKKSSGALKFAGLAVVMLLVFNGPSIFLNLKWWYVTDYQNHSWPQYAASSPSSQDNTLVISKIGVSAPIIWDTTAENRGVAMAQGIAAISGNVRPDDGKTIVLAGHTNDHWWNKNPYGQVFALLPYLVAGDTITIKNNGRDFTYIVSNVVRGMASDLTGAEGQLILVSPQPIVGNQRVFVIAQRVTTAGVLDTSR